MDERLFDDDYERHAHPRQRMQKLCTEAVRYSVNATLGEDDRQQPVTRSLYGYLLQEMAEASMKYAAANNINPDDFEIDVLDRAIAMVQSLRSAFVKDWNDRTLDFWDSVSRPLDKIRADKVPYIDRSSLESAAGDYLALPYRSQALDRMLVRVLIAMEFYAYGDEMMNEKSFGFPPVSPLKQRHVLLGYLRGLFVNAVVLGGIAALALFAASKGWISETSAAWTSGTCASLFLLFGTISTFALPFAWYAQAKARWTVRKLLLAMATIYNELRSDGPISAQHIRERVSSAAQDGVVTGRHHRSHRTLLKNTPKTAGSTQHEQRHGQRLVRLHLYVWHFGHRFNSLRSLGETARSSERRDQSRRCTDRRRAPRNSRRLETIPKRCSERRATVLDFLGRHRRCGADLGCRETRLAARGEWRRHSLRACFLTSAAGKGASIFKMMDVSRHKSVDTLRGYVRDAELFKDHAGAGLLWGG
jgi:hypothetical protein